jgi:hypothetical protein
MGENTSKTSVTKGGACTRRGVLKTIEQDASVGAEIFIDPMGPNGTALLGKTGSLVATVAINAVEFPGEAIGAVVGAVVGGVTEGIAGVPRGFGRGADVGSQIEGRGVGKIVGATVGTIKSGVDCIEEKLTKARSVAKAKLPTPGR